MRNTKIFIISIATCVGFLVHAQTRADVLPTLYKYQDTANQFSIGIPIGWTYRMGTPQNPGIKLIVTRLKATEPDSLRVSYNVNIIAFPNSSIDLAYESMLNSISTRSGFMLINEGDTVVEDLQYKWLVE